MPTSATDFVSLTVAKESLRIDGTYLDGDLENNLEAGVQAVERDTGYIILDRTKKLNVERPLDSDCPAMVNAMAVKSVTSIAYWTPTQKLRENPSGVVMIAPSDPPVDTDNPIGRTEQVTEQLFEIWPPATGWPEILTQSHLVITISQGWDDDFTGLPNINILKRAVIIWAGRGLDGIAVDPGERAYWNIIATARRGLA